MEIKRDTSIQFDLLKAMGLIVSSMNNEEAHDGSWLYLYPDGADDEELQEIAEDDAYFDEITETFFKVCKNYGKDGFCTF